jgi:NOL1/NOP2/fmu family ribosome biogenesis protein
LLVANEIHPKRAWDLAENLERFGVRNAAILQETPERLAEHFGAFFDRVLLDAPCSGEGMFRKSEAARQEWSPELVQGCALRQFAILEQAARMVRPGGWLAYVTCTFSPEEDEAQLARFLSSQSGQEPHFELVDVQEFPAFAPGRPDWAAHPAAASLGLEKAVRMWPHRQAGDGHFMALLRRVDGSPGDQLPPWRSRLPKETQALYAQFCQESLSQPLETGNLFLKGQYLYNLPAGLPDLSGLHVIHPGWWLGEIKKDRFEPSHALALGLEAANARLTLSLPPENQAARAYLRGETLESSGENGWALVCVQSPVGDFPMGWGRRVNERVKNHYPKGLRVPN